MRMTAVPTELRYSLDILPALKRRALSLHIRKPDVPGGATAGVNWEDLFEQAREYRADPDETIDRVRAGLRELRDE